MGIFSRLSDIINSNLNAMLDRAEDPEKLVKLMISEMEDTLIEIKSSAAEVVADRIRVERNLKSETRRMEDWASKAELAMGRDREDLAREALEQKLYAERSVSTLQDRLSEIEGVVKQYQSDIARLEEKLVSAKKRQRAMIAAHKSAESRRKVEEKIYKVNTSGAFAKFEHFEQRLDRVNAETEILEASNDSLEKRFQDLEHENAIQQELEALKKRMEKKSA